jgi:hypothetical protein
MNGERASAGLWGMANRPAPALTLRDGDREALVRLTRSAAARAGLAVRARIVLAAADGVANEQIAERIARSKVTVLKWRGRYQAQGLAGLDVNRPGFGGGS